MCFLYCLNLSLSLAFSCTFISQAEALFTSVERVAAFTNLEKDGEHSEVDNADSFSGPGGLRRVSVGIPGSDQLGD